MKAFFAGMGMFVVLTGTVWAADAPAVYDKKCKACHSVGGVGGPMAKMGGALDDAGSKHDEAWLRDFLKDPKSKVPTSKMPKVGLSDEELNQVVAYLLSLKQPAAK